MLQIQVTSNKIQLLNSNDYVSGTVNAQDIQFFFDEAWDGLIKIASFKAGSTSIDVTLTANENDRYVATIPHEVLAIQGQLLMVGVVGLNGNAITLPTPYLILGAIVQGTQVSGIVPDEPTPPIYIQLVEGIQADISSLQNATEGLQSQITANIPAQADWAEADEEAKAYIKNKPTLFDGSYNSLDDKPFIPLTVDELTDKADYATVASLADVATSGDYTDLINKPTIPTTVAELTDNANYQLASALPADVRQILPEIQTSIHLSAVLAPQTHYILGSTEELVFAYPMAGIAGQNIKLMFTAHGSGMTWNCETSGVKGLTYFAPVANHTYSIDTIFNGTSWIVTSLMDNGTAWQQPYRLLHTAVMESDYMSSQYIINKDDDGNELDLTSATIYLYTIPASDPADDKYLLYNGTTNAYINSSLNFVTGATVSNSHTQFKIETLCDGGVEFRIKPRTGLLIVNTGNNTQTMLLPPSLVANPASRIKSIGFGTAGISTLAVPLMKKDSVIMIYGK